MQSRTTFPLHSEPPDQATDLLFKISLLDCQHPDFCVCSAQRTPLYLFLTHTPSSVPMALFPLCGWRDMFFFLCFSASLKTPLPAETFIQFLKWQYMLKIHTKWPSYAPAQLSSHPFSSYLYPYRYLCYCLFPDQNIKYMNTCGQDFL